MRSLPRAAALFLTFCTGLSALVYEVTWQRSLANFLGSAAQATAIILAVFLGGLCLGYHLFGDFSSRRSSRTLVLGCGVSEIIIAIWALLFPSLYRFIWNAGGIVSPSSAFSLFWEFGISILLIGPPTILMGGTLPLLTQGLSRDLEDARSFHARIYALNTAGAFIGCLLSGFYLIPHYGLSGTIQVVGAFNLVCGILLSLTAFLTKESIPPSGASEVPLEVANSKSSLSPRKANTIAACAGFCSLCLQTIYIRLIGLTMGSSEYAFSMIVAVFISMLSLGSWLVSQRPQQSNGVSKNQFFALLGAALVFFTVPTWPYACYLLRLSFTPYIQSFYFYHLALFLFTSLLLSFPVGMMGATMPRLFAAVAAEREQLGKIVGQLYAWNTIGCVLGALAGGHWLLYFFDLDTVYRLCLFIFLMSLAFSFSWQDLKNSGRSIPVASTLLLLAIAIGELPSWNKEHLGTGLFRERTPRSYMWDGPSVFYEKFLGTAKQIFYRDGPNSTVAVSEFTTSGENVALNNGATFTRNLKVNGKSDGETSLGDTLTMRLLAHLPILLSGTKVKNVGVVGFGLGVAAGTSTLYPEVEHVEVMEISPAVIWAAPLFDFANYSASKNPKVHIRLGDAYRTLTSSDMRFSVILSEPSNPWVTGVERLFSKEFYSIVKRQLEPRGIYAQWIHEYSLSEETLSMVLRTFYRSFPSVRIFRANRDIILLGSNEPLGLENVRMMIERYSKNEDVRQALGQVGIENIGQLSGFELWTSAEQFPGTLEQSLDFPRLALLAGRDFFLDDDSNLLAILQRPEQKIWAQSASRLSLIASLQKISSEPDSFVADYAKGACALKSLSLLTGWASHGDSCKMSVAAAVALGKLPVPDASIQPEILGLLRNLSELPQSADLDSWNQLIPSMDLKMIETVFDSYESFHSIFLPLSIRKLELVGGACEKFSGEELARCRAHYVRALALIGEPKLARTSFEQLRSTLSKSYVKEELQFLDNLIGTSERAFKYSSQESAPQR